MEGIDLAGVVDSDFQGIQINFAPPRPTGFANFCGAGRGKTCFLRGGAGRGSPFSAGRGTHPWCTVRLPWYVPIATYTINQTLALVRHRWPYEVRMEVDTRAAHIGRRSLALDPSRPWFSLIIPSPPWFSPWLPHKRSRHPQWQLFSRKRCRRPR